MKRQVAVVGVGGIAQAHLTGWLEQPDAEIALLCDVNRTIAEERQQRYGLTAARIVSSLEEVFDSDCTLVDLCTPSFLHAEQSVACLEAGRHVLCEKPMANALAEAELIAAAAARHPELVYMCEHRMLFDPLVVAVRQRIEAIGQPFWFRQRSAHALAISPSIAATGAFLDIGYHPLYTALHFLGPAERVYALQRQSVRPELANDNGLYVCEHGQAVSVVEGSFSSIGMMGGTRPFELYGERGTFIGNWMPQPQLQLFTGEQGGPSSMGEPISIPPGSWIGNAIRHFLDLVNGLAQPLADAAAALQTMQAYDAALRAVATGRSQEIVRAGTVG